MALDALDPGPDWTFPNAPRTPEGYLDPERMPVGTRLHRDPTDPRRTIRIDVEPTVRDQSGNLRRISELVPLPPGYIKPTA